MSSVKFGWRVPAFPADGSQHTAFLHQITSTLQKIDGKFDSFWVADHFIPWADFVDVTTPTLECWSSICYLAAAFPNFDVGSIVMSQSYRNPAWLAKSAATLQWLTGGRLIFGLGAGWKEDEYRAYNYDFPRASVRIKQLEEAVQIIRKMWTESQATFTGEYYQIADAYCEPHPNPTPPILIGGGGEKLTLRVVAKHADWWNLGGSLASYGHKLDVLRSHCDAVGRDYDEIIKTWGEEGMIVAENDTDAQRIADHNPYGSTSGVDVHTPEHIVERLQQYVELGVSYFIIRFADFPNTDGIELFAEEVIPHFR